MSEEQAGDRAAVVRDAWEARGRAPYTERTAFGAVTIERIEYHPGSDGPAYIEAWIGGQTEGGDPHYRIFSPPLLVGGEEAPLAALAEVIAQNGGAQAPQDKRRSRG